MRSKIIAGILTLASGLVAQQPCSTLTVTGTGAPNTTLTFAVEGAGANTLAILLIGQAKGTTSIPLGALGTIDLGLATPFVPVPLGRTDSDGDVSRGIDVPSSAGALRSLFGQALTIKLQIGRGRPTLDDCTSNVAGFKVGSSS